MPADAAPQRHRYHPLRVRRIVQETPEARSIVFEVPSELAGVFAFEAGQFVTLRVARDDRTHVRSYSMSSSPEADGELRVTVKRVPGGLVSNWLNDGVEKGDVLDVGRPGGAFVLDRGGHDIAAFAAGSGITPVFSILKTALATTDRRVRLLYANRSRDAAIFGDELDALAARYPDRLLVEYHEDLVRGFIDRETVARHAGDAVHAVHYVCGPDGFMDTVRAALRDLGVDRTRIRVERFTPAEQPAAGAVDGLTVTIKLGRTTATAVHRRGDTILQTARSAGLRPPSSCETGTCATCMARVVQGRADMRNNDALTPDEVAEGWVLTCQAVPRSPVIEVVYG
ncbi:ferredoxin--NADP reductase [Actinomadura sp. WMMB 499]|uniref:ferredoxin--NADP reductase n=1 Tax=Actinomadura sp. WMMB 499 TaxID=1219491 RepID=UPI001246D033|nr:ferredoxin--NADP reductase [Actinomadura sp. WMMB 499]QFG22182.1 ferredoxin--NADP reductase [Actinomadura sp. WMMB 499]